MKLSDKEVSKLSRLVSDSEYIVDYLDSPIKSMRVQDEHYVRIDATIYLVCELVEADFKVYKIAEIYDWKGINI